jgi:uncharacterized membrane protein YfcA
MNIAEFTAVVAGASAVAGCLGALTGLGGGVVVTPVLVLILGVDMRYAIGARLRLGGSFPGELGDQPYMVHLVPAGFGLMYGAGLISGLLGIGSGAFKVLAMDRIMHIPFKVSTATSNFMIGVTAAASAGIYWHRGFIELGLAMPVVLGGLAGSLVGARMLPRAPVRLLRLVFAVVVGALALEMIYGGITGRI